MKPTTWTPLLEWIVRDLWADGFKAAAIARVVGVTPNAILGCTTRWQLHSPVSGQDVAGLPADHRAMVDARALFPGTVVDPPVDAGYLGLRVLKSGANARKLGAIVKKGAWRGYPIFSLTLEERATCPRECHNFGRCFGNGMPRSKRYRHGPELDRAIDLDLAELQAAHPGGFVVRLHVLGDFYSVAYLRQWERWLDQFPALHVFGYTAWDWLTDLGGEIALLAFTRWDRFAVRMSHTDPGKHRAITVTTQDPLPAGAILCPAQTDKTTGCNTCALCWSTAAQNRTIAFLVHGRVGGSVAHERGNNLDAGADRGVAQAGRDNVLRGDRPAVGRVEERGPWQSPPDGPDQQPAA